MQVPEKPSQPVDCVAFETVPGAQVHGEHAVLPRAENVRMPQAAGGAVPPAQIKPGGHGVQAAAAADGVYVPATQASAGAAPPAQEKPLWHGAQSPVTPSHESDAELVVAYPGAHVHCACAAGNATKMRSAASIACSGYTFQQHVSVFA